MNYLGEVTIEANISKGSTLVINRKYSGYNKSGTNWAASSGVFGDILEKSLNSVTSQLINDIDSIDIGHYLKAANDINMPINQSKFTETSDSVKTNSVTSNEDIKSDSIDCPITENGIVIIVGKRTMANVKSVLDSIKTELKSIFNDRFELNPSLSGNICISFAISPEGKVFNIKILQNSLQDEPIKEKLLESLTNCRFQRLTERDESTIIHFNLNFDPKSAKVSKRGIGVVVAILAIIPLIISIVNLQNLTKGSY